MEKNIISHHYINELSDFLRDSEVFSIYRYNPQECRKGRWGEDSSLNYAVGEEVGLENSRVYTAKTDGEMLRLYAVVIQIDIYKADNRISLVTNGSHIVPNYSTDGDPVFGVSGGFGVLDVTLNEGETYETPMMIFSSDFVECASPSVETFLVVRDKFNPAVFMM